MPVTIDVTVTCESTDDVAEVLRRVKDAFALTEGGLTIDEEKMLAKALARQYSDQDLLDLATLKDRIDKIERQLP